jgi:hypothetical protein
LLLTASLITFFLVSFLKHCRDNQENVVKLSVAGAKFVFVSVELLMRFPRSTTKKLGGIEMI